MDTVLVIVTGVSLALAAGMGMLLARMMREERERSDARVQLLEGTRGKRFGQAEPPARRAGGRTTSGEGGGPSLHGHAGSGGAFRGSASRPDGAVEAAPGRG